MRTRAFRCGVTANVLRISVATALLHTLPWTRADDADAPADGSDAITFATGDDITSLSLEELMDIEVTSVRKKSEKLGDAAAAIYVVTQEDIRRSGVRTLPEALRMVPGIQVAQLDANKWAISARGFNSRFSNKLLVLLDGRSVYTPLFSGVYWDTHDILLEDVERIEVIRGPGGTLWGANAVNGVINVITKSAKATQGSYVGVGGGSEELGTGEARYGGAIGESAYYRVYGKYAVRDGFVDDDGDRTDDDWESLRSGFRVDWDVSPDDLVTLQADIYYVRTGSEILQPNAIAPDFERRFDDNVFANGQSVLARWSHTIDEGSDLTFQTYYDRTSRNEALFEDTRDTFDVEFQHRFRLPWDAELLWGLNYRLSYDDLHGTAGVDMSPRQKDEHLVSLFLQKDASFLDDALRLTIGSKFDYNNYTKFELQPSARVIWRLHEDHRVWASVSRAVRTPSRADVDGDVIFRSVPGAPPTLVRLEGNRDFDAEDLLAFEVGYRANLLDRLNVDLSAYYNRYENLRTLEPGAVIFNPGPPAHNVQPLAFENRMEGEAFGVELASTWRVNDWWRLTGSVTYLSLQLRLDSDSNDTVSEMLETQAPRHAATLQSVIDLPWNLEFDTSLYYSDRLASFDVGSYVRLDARLGWRPRGDDSLDLSIVGQNLIDRHHAEFGRELLESSSEVERAVYAMLSMRF